MINNREGPRNTPTLWLVDRPSIVALSLNALSLSTFLDAGKATCSSPVRRQFRTNIRKPPKYSGLLAFAYHM
jgi:hypothetical protein